LADVPDKKSGRTGELRKYGIVMAVALAAIGGLLFWRGKNHHLIFFALAAVFLVAGLAVPGLLGPVYKAWMTLARMMGWVMTRVILTVSFLVVLVPLGLFLRLCGKDLLDVRFKTAGQGSYWKEKNPENAGKRDYEKQF